LRWQRQEAQVLKLGDLQGSALPVVLPMDFLAPVMGSGGVGTVRSSLAELEEADGSVLPPSLVPISTNSSPLPELFSGSISSSVGIVGSPSAETEDVGGLVPPPSPVVPISANSTPLPELFSGSVSFGVGTVGPPSA
jgi:hypothetical protein